MTKHQKSFKVTDDILASLGQRFLNYLVDSGMQAIIFMVLVLHFALNREVKSDKDLANFLLHMNGVNQFKYSAGALLIYYNIFEILFAKTIGKLITQTVVVDENGEKPDHQMILMRSLCRLIPFEAITFIGYPSRGWHDSFSKTYVVSKRKLEESKQSFYALNKTEGNL